ncbi:hypothetical protein [Actinomycetospora lemnae]|uniref:Uncharacterized protein n=1 Tax=Actinomycetospora lemnae TaxID=3019891 RepID=A0ABT5STG1_9PSEU|nr:hypothetical protein [Actinomycetospora sp. DW7H6]MDD7966128.1 hypothetical protein [Actinomycetospora sp. DW7H6]
MSQPEQGRDFPQVALRWPGKRHEAYLDTRPDETSRYNPAAEYGDVDWREPASDAEAAARTAYLHDHFPPAPGWPTRRLTEVEDALGDAQERAVLSDRARDPDPYAWAQYERLQALEGHAPLPAHGALDDLPLDEHAWPDTLAAPERQDTGWRDEDQVVRDHLADEAAFDGRDASSDTADAIAVGRDGPFFDTQGRWWPSTGAWAAGTCDPSRRNDPGYLEAPDDPERLRQRVEDLRASLAARAQEGLLDDEQRREQLTRWYDDDHAATRDADSRDSGEDGVGGSGWAR